MPGRLARRRSSRRDVRSSQSCWTKKVVRTGSDKCLNKVESIRIFLDKFSLAPEDVYYVGDAASDVAQAKEAGVHSIAVTWNCIVDKEGIEREKPEAVFKEVSEFNKYLNGLLK